MSALTKTDVESEHDNNIAHAKKMDNQPQCLQSYISKKDHVRSKPNSLQPNPILNLPQMAKKVNGFDDVNDVDIVVKKSEHPTKESLEMEKNVTGHQMESNARFNTHATKDSILSINLHGKSHTKPFFTESTSQPQRRSNETPSENKQNQFCTPLKTDKHLDRKHEKDLGRKTNLTSNNYNNITKPSQTNRIPKQLEYNAIPTNPNFTYINAKNSNFKEAKIIVANSMTSKLESEEVLSIKSDDIGSSIEGTQFQSLPVHQKNYQMSVNLSKKSITTFEREKNVPDENFLFTDEKLSDDKEFSSPSSFLETLITKSHNTFDTKKMIQHAKKDTKYFMKQDKKAIQKRKKNTPTKAKTKRRRKDKAESPNNLKLPIKGDGDTINGAEIMMSLVVRQEDKSPTENATGNVPTTNDKNSTKIEDFCNLPGQLNYNLRKTTTNHTHNKDYDILSKLPKLPVEPEFNERPNTANITYTSSELRANEDGLSMFMYRQDAMLSLPKLPPKVFEPTIGFIHRPSSTTGLNVTADSWWPYLQSSLKSAKQNSIVKISNENKKQGRKNGKKHSNQAKANKSTEPFVLHKIPHCKKYLLECSSSDAASNRKPLFCFQVTEIFPKDLMVCCSICFTWRHVCCGGHHCISGIKLAKLNKPFVPICDFCFKEKKRYSENIKIKRSLNQRRREHLRRSLISHKIMRNASNLKQKTSNWPLGSVKAEKIKDHINEVFLQNQILVKEWNEMSNTLGKEGSGKTKDRMKTRSKYFEQLLGYLEDAELATDQHNMMLFLERDTSKERPVGYEINHRNIFDPADDDIYSEYENDKESDDEKKESSYSVKVDGKVNNETNSCSSENSTSSTTSLSYERSSCVMSDKNNEKESGTQISTHADRAIGRIGNKANSQVSSSQSIKNRLNARKINVFSDDESSILCETLKSQCARPGCSMKPRYDSLFCCDACGICALEIDLMSSLEYASTMHPSLLRLK